mmetsp:Transcript_24599/g.55561  ORF Transcript_24599/g.55561 Transcript_24599/m.55561 type:complete len:85 (+) Transcript_24599:41-295(+)
MGARKSLQPWEIGFLLMFWGLFAWYMSQWDGELVNKTFFWQFVSLFFWCYNHLASFFGILMAVAGLYTAGGQLVGGIGGSKKRR